VDSSIKLDVMPQFWGKITPKSSNKRMNRYCTKINVSISRISIDLNSIVKNGFFIHRLNGNWVSMKRLWHVNSLIKLDMMPQFWDTIPYNPN
jgi:hypothetical protein